MTWNNYGNIKEYDNIQICHDKRELRYPTTGRKSSFPIDKVVLDFSGVNVVSNSFADECLAKLLLIMPLEELKQRTTFRGLNEFARKNIAIAFRRRLNAMKAVKRV